MGQGLELQGVLMPGRGARILRFVQRAIIFIPMEPFTMWPVYFASVVFAVCFVVFKMLQAL